jgi:hypothetical protein
MLKQFRLDNRLVDALDLKVLLISNGAVVPDATFQKFASQRRLTDPTNLMACNCVILPDGVAAHLTANEESPFRIGVTENGRPALEYHGELVTEVEFPPSTAFYEQSTSTGRSFGLYAVLEGMGILAFHYLWPCQFARSGEICAFCFQGLADVAGMNLPSPTQREAGEMVAWGLRDGCVREVQLTGGSRFSPSGECPQVAAVLRGIDEIAGIANIPGEIYAYLSAPALPEAVDEVFEAGIDRVAYDLNLWDVQLHAEVCPGHARHIGRERQLKALEYVAHKYGPNKACSAFVVGLEPLESLIEGAEYLGSRGIVPLLSVWMPGVDPILGQTHPPDMDYYRQARQAFAKIYARYQLTPPGITAGAHVSMCRDVYDHLEEMLPPSENITQNFTPLEGRQA